LIVDATIVVSESFLAIVTIQDLPTTPRKVKLDNGEIFVTRR
jgi:hypothetical protein